MEGDQEADRELGVRFTHFQPWVDPLGFGYSIFDVPQFQPACAPALLRVRMARQGLSVPVGGFPTRALFYQPRLGAAYDVRGTGRTVLRGGWGRFYYHSGQFTSGLDASAGVKSATISPSTWVGGAGCPTNPATGSALFAHTCLVSMSLPRRLLRPPSTRRTTSSPIPIAGASTSTSRRRSRV